MANLSNNLEQPPDYGSLQFSVDGPPASLQSSSGSRQEVESRVTENLEDVQYLLADDVQVEIRWFIHERDRYESDAAPDIDNILKPLMDALCGADGLIIDDCQVQAVGCYWLDSNDGSQRLGFSVDYSPDSWVKKKGLRFIHVYNGLCYPLPGDLNDRQSRFMTEMIKMIVEMRDEFEDLGADYYQSKLLMPSQRVFHRTRVASEFEVLEAEDILS